MNMFDHTNNNPNPGRPLPQTPAELRSIESLLDELGAEARSSASEALEDRIYIASRVRLGAGDATPVVARIGGRFAGPARIAAGIAIVVGAAALIGWLALTPPPAPQDNAVAIEAAAIDEEFETWLAAASVWDDMEAFVAPDVESEMAALSDEIASPWFALEDPLLSEELF